MAIRDLVYGAAVLIFYGPALPGQTNYPYVNAGAAGVTVNSLVAPDTSSPTLFVTASSNQCGVGFALAAAASGGAFPIASVAGTIQTGIADSSVTAGNILVAGTTGGRVRDSGSPSRNAIGLTTCIVGVALTSGSTGGAVGLIYDGPGSYGNGGNIGLSVVEGSAPAGVSLSDLLWADSTAHRWKINNNNGGAVQVVAAGADINNSDQVASISTVAASTVLIGTNASKQVVAASTTGSGTTAVLSTSPTIIHPLGGGASPSATAGNCGTSNATVHGTDSAGRLTISSSGSVSACTIAFATSWGSNAPVCVANDENSFRGITVTTTTSTVTLTPNSAFAATDVISWLCVGY